MEVFQQEQTVVSLAGRKFYCTIAYVVPVVSLLACLSSNLKHRASADLNYKLLA